MTVGDIVRPADPVCNLFGKRLWFTDDHEFEEYLRTHAPDTYRAMARRAQGY